VPRNDKNGDEVARKPKKRTLFFRNLSDTTEEEDLMEIFAKKLPDVKIVDVRIIRDEQGVKRGIGFVDVET
jgi:RNA recognition motif-containing protein